MNRGNYRGNFRRNSGNTGWGDSSWADNQHNEANHVNGEKALNKVSFSHFFSTLTRLNFHLMLQSFEIQNIVEYFQLDSWYCQSS